MSTFSRGLFGSLRRCLNVFRHRPPSQRSLHRLMERLEYYFHSDQLLVQALKHRSYLVFSGEDRLQSNERLELLGDAVLGLVITEHLYHQLPDAEEGALTNHKSSLVNRSHLSRAAHRFGLGDFLYLNDSEERAGGRQRESILADAVEAVIGAVYLDGGMEPARRLILRTIAPELPGLKSESSLRNHKSLLLEWCQREGHSGPVYLVEEEKGPDHQKIFSVAVVVNGVKYGRGEGPSKKIAEQKAAEEALGLSQSQTQKE
jgi:ribonuclease III